jgi:hypothetical protein
MQQMQAIIVQHACMIKPAATWLHSFDIGSCMLLQDAASAHGWLLDHCTVAEQAL